MSIYDIRPDKGIDTRDVVTAILSVMSLRAVQKSTSASFPTEALAPVVANALEQSSLTLSSLGRTDAIEEDVRYLEERVRVIERLEGRIRELETDAAARDDLRRALKSVLANLEAVEDHQSTDTERVDKLVGRVVADSTRTAQLEARLEAIEGVFSERVVEKEQAHVAAMNRSVTDVVELGEVYDIYVEEVTVGPEPRAIGRIQRLVVFVHFDQTEVDVTRGDLLKVRITDTQDTCAHGVPVFEEGDR